MAAGWGVAAHPALGADGRGKLAPTQARPHLGAHESPEVVTVAAALDGFDFHVHRDRRVPGGNAALAHAQGRRPPLIEPHPFDRDGCRVICYPGDPEHPVSEPAWQGPTRLTYRNRRFEPDGGLAALLA